MLGYNHVSVTPGQNDDQAGVELRELASLMDRQVVARAFEAILEWRVVEQECEPVLKFELMDQGRETVRPEATSDHGDFYDDDGLPA